MFKTVLTALVFVLFGFAAQAQSADNLAESMRKSLSHCVGSSNSYSEPDSTYRNVHINEQCAKVQFQALQTYIDAASKCIAAPATNEGFCKEAKIIELSLIRTFQPPKVAKK